MTWLDGIGFPMSRKYLQAWIFGNNAFHSMEICFLVFTPMPGSMDIYLNSDKIKQTAYDEDQLLMSIMYTV